MLAKMGQLLILITFFLIEMIAEKNRRGAEGAEVRIKQREVTTAI